MNLGDELPSLELNDENGQPRNLKDWIGKPSVFFFYPKDETPGCVAEVCAFRDAYEDFMELGAEVIGISADSEESHRKFKERRRLPFTLLTDANKIGEKAFGIKRSMFGLIPVRITFIFDEKGKMIHEFDSHLNPTGHMTEALEALKNISK